jgi:hypothetical protein
MIGRTFAIMIGAACLLAASSVGAQQTNNLDQCRDEAVRRQVSGDRLSGFLTSCMQEKAAAQTQPSGSMGSRASYDRCRQEGIGRGLTGDALYNSVSDCLSRSGAADASMAGTYQQCRADARARGLGGTQLDDYLNGCIAR